MKYWLVKSEPFKYSWTMMLKDKVKYAIKNNLKVVFCIGENKIEKKNKKTLNVLKKQLTKVLEKKFNKNVSQKLTESDMNIIKKMINKLSTKEITDILSQISDVSKKEIYNHCLELKNEK